MSHLSLEPEAEWLGSRRFWLVCIAALVLVVALLSARTTQVVSRHADPVELHIYGQPRLAPGQNLVFRVLVSDGKDQKPIAGAPVSVALVDGQGRRTELATGVSEKDGVFVVRYPLRADFPEGEYRVVANTSGPLGTSDAAHAVSVRREVRVLLTTDKPLYQPGQTIHLRALALETADDRPAAGREIQFEAQDGKGNKVFKYKLVTSQFGIASADFALADQVNTGDYALVASIAGATAQRSVTVKSYVLPKFRLELSTDRASYQPADKINGEVRAVYTFGKPVAGAHVQLVANEFIESFRSFATLDGTTDENGSYRFSIALPPSLVGQELARGNALVKLDATVSATAGGEQTRSRELHVSSQPLRIEAVPERGELLRGVSNRIFLIVSTPEGEPVAARLTVRGIGPQEQRIETSRLGIARIEITPDAASATIAPTLVAETANGLRAEASPKLTIGAARDVVLLRPDRAVYRVGDSVRLTVLSPLPDERAFVDVVKDRRTVMMHALDVKSGHGELVFDLPPDLTGTLELCGYALLGNGEIVRDVRLIQVQPKDDLQITMQPDKPSYAPGERAIVDLSVRHSDGKPVAAALGVVGVDEAVYALYDSQPGLESLYFALQADLLKPRYEVHAHLPPLLSDSHGADIDEAHTVLLSAATQRAATEGWAGSLYRERQAEFEQAATLWFRTLRTAAFLAPIGIFTLLFLLATVYSFLRLRRPPFAEADSDRDEFERKSGRVMRDWLLGILLPLPTLALGEMIGDMYHLYGRERRFATLCIVGVNMLFMCALLFRDTAALRKSSAIEGRALFQKILTTVPFAYLCGALGILLLSYGASERIVESDPAIIGILVAIGVAVLYFGVLSVLRQSSLREVSPLGWFWLFLSRSIALVLPALLLPMTLVAAKRAAPVEEMRPAFMANSMPMPDGAPITETAASDLKAPTRVRRHFPETLLWKPEVITDGEGKARLEIPLADSITTWRLAASAVSARGELGAMALGLPVFQDFFVDIEFPATLTQHDEVSVPVSVYNYLDKPQRVRLDLDAGQATWLKPIGGKSRTLQIGAKQTASVAFRVRIETPGKHTLTVRASGSELADAVERQVVVVPDGQLVTQTLNGRLEPQVAQDVTIPQNAIAGGSDLYLKIYPGAFSQVVEGLDGIFHMPSGCFEQTSSTTYPSVLALDYLRRTKQTKPDLELKALNYIGLGYQRLLSFEVAGGGFEWFGNAPAHNLLTAYGLLEFRDMAQVYSVDKALLERTRAWLWRGQREGRFTPTSGGIAEGAINQYQGDTLRASAYIAWAIAEADVQLAGQVSSELHPTLDWLATAEDDGDAYTLALRAMALLAARRPAQAKPLVDRLAKLAVKAGEDVYFPSKSKGVTYSFGESMQIETTGLVAQVLLRAGEQQELAYRALRWLISKRDASGTWGSTQPTIAAMRALIAGSEGGGVKSDVQVGVRANDAPAGTVTITPDTSDVYRLISLRPQVKNGVNRIAFTRSGEGDVAYQIVATHYLPWPQESAKREAPKESMTLAVKYDASTVKQDSLLGVRVDVRWNQPGAAQMALVDLGIPPGFDVVTEDLQKLVDSGAIQRFASSGRQLIVYLAEVAQNKPQRIEYHLRARYAVRAKTPASRAYPYYQPEAGGRAEPVLLTVE